MSHALSRARSVTDEWVVFKSMSKLDRLCWPSPWGANDEMVRFDARTCRIKVRRWCASSLDLVYEDDARSVGRQIIWLWDMVMIEGSRKNCWETDWLTSKLCAYCNLWRDLYIQLPVPTSLLVGAMETGPTWLRIEDIANHERTRSSKIPNKSRLNRFSSDTSFPSKS